MSPTALPGDHAQTMLSSFTLLLSSRRILASHDRSRHELDETQVQAASDRIDRLATARDEWALRVPTDDPEFWITVYTRLLHAYRALRSELFEDANGLSEQPRHLALAIDVPSLDRRIDAYEGRLQRWRIRMAEPGTVAESAPPRAARSGAPRPAARRRPLPVPT